MYAQMLKEAVCPLEEAAGGFPTSAMPEFLSDLLGTHIDKAMARKVIPLFMNGLRAGMQYQDPSWDRTVPVKMATDEITVEYWDLQSGPGEEVIDVKYPTEVLYTGTIPLDVHFLSREIGKSLKRFSPDAVAAVRANLGKALIKHRAKILPAFKREVEQGIEQMVRDPEERLDHGEIWNFIDFDYAGQGDDPEPDIPFRGKDKAYIPGEVTSITADITPRLIAGYKGKSLPIQTKVVFKIKWKPSDWRWEFPDNVRAVSRAVAMASP